MTRSEPVMLTIAGSDSSGGAGIQADLKTATALGVYGASAVTALTAQNTRGVQGVHPVPAGFVADQLASVLDDLDVRAVKIGMLGDDDVIAAVADALDRLPGVPVVLDPVMVATSGDRLVPDSAVAAILDQLVGRATVVTPNVPEAALLTGLTVADVDGLEPAGRRLVEAGAAYALVKGGHLDGADVVDVLVSQTDSMVGACASPLAPGCRATRLTAPRVDTPHTHGTGCTLSSAVAARLARGDEVPAAVSAARAYLHRALTSGRGRTVGGGHDPVDHLVDLR